MFVIQDSGINQFLEFYEDSSDAELAMISGQPFLYLVGIVELIYLLRDGGRHLKADVFSCTSVDCDPLFLSSDLLGRGGTVLGVRIPCLHSRDGRNIVSSWTRAPGSDSRMFDGLKVSVRVSGLVSLISDVPVSLAHEKGLYGL